MKLEIVSVLMFFCWSLPAVAQQGSNSSTAAENQSASATQLIRDQLSLTAMRQSLLALGGPSVQSISDYTAIGTVTSANGANTSSFTWKAAGSELRTEVSNGHFTNIVTTGHGSAAMRKNGKTRAIPYHMARMMYPFFNPAMIFSKALNDSRYSVTDAKAETLNNSQVVRVHLVDYTDIITGTVTGQDWFLDASTLLPVAVRYHIPDPYDAAASEKKRTEVLNEFSAYTQVNGVMMPFHIRTTIAGSISDAQITSLTCNSGITNSEFDLPIGGAQ